MCEKGQTEYPGVNSGKKVGSSGKKVGRSGKKVGERRGADRSRVVILIRSIEKCHIHQPRGLLLQVG